MGGLSRWAARAWIDERMDEPDVDPDELRGAMRFIRRVNRWLLGTRAVIRALTSLARAWPPGETISLVDVGTGSGDIPRALVAWGRRRGHAVRVVGLDLHPATVAEASRWLRTGHDVRPRLVRGDALRIPLADRSVDVATASLLLHHLDDEDGVRLLREMDRVARRGIVVQDLLRSRRAHAWIWLLTRLVRNSITRFDGPASVRRGFRPHEARELARAAGLPWLTFRRRLGHRFTLAGQRETGNG